MARPLFYTHGFQVKGILLLLITCMSTRIQAQDFFAPDRTDTLQFKSLWLKTQNFAAFPQTDLMEESLLKFTVSQEHGSFRRPQDPRSERALNFFADRYQKMGAWTFYGKFNFQKQDQKQRVWSQLLDINRGTPYVLTDSTLGDWSKQYFNLEAFVAKQINARLSVAVGLDYAIGSGAKTLDPRPQSDVNTIRVLPSLTYKINERNSIGLSTSYKKYKENIAVAIRNTNRVYGIYRLTGLSFHSGILPTSSGFSRFYQGNAYAADLQHGYKGKSSLEILTAVGYSSYAESTRDGSTLPQQAGDYEQAIYKFSSAVKWNRGHLKHLIALEAELQNDKGTEYQYANNQLSFKGELYTAEYSHLGLSYSLLHASPYPLQQYKWFLKIQSNYQSNYQQYKTLPETSSQEINTLNTAVTLGHQVGRNLSLLYTLAYQKPQVESLVFNPGTQLNNLSYQILYPGYIYLTAKSLHYQGKLKYALTPRTWMGTGRFYGSYEFQLLHNQSQSSLLDIGKNRIVQQISIGVTY